MFKWSKKKYNKRQITQFCYKSFYPLNIPDRKVKVKDLIIRSRENLFEISDNGFKGIIQYDDINEELTAKYGFYIRTNAGEYVCSDLKDALKIYLQNQDVAGIQNYRLSLETIIASSPLTAYNNLIINFLTIGCSPIYFNNFTEILTHGGLLYGFKDSLNNFNKLSISDYRTYLPPPHILYGAFYLKDNLVKYRVCDDALDYRNINIDEAIKPTGIIFKSHFIDDSKFSYFLEDTTVYKNYNHYVSEFKKLDRDKKLNDILT